MFPNFTTLLELALLAGSPKIIIDSDCNSMLLLLSFSFWFMLTFGEKMKITNTQNLPAPVVELLKRNYYTKGASQYSVTELMSPPQIRRLREQYDNEIEIDVIDLFATQFGTFMHGKLEAKEIEGYINEERLFAEVDGITISGAIDLQKIEEGGVKVIDYKFVKAWSVMQNKVEWEIQLNVYKWLVETVKRRKVTGLQICAFIKDYSKWESKEGYPQAPIVMIDIPTWDSVRAETYVRERLEMHRTAKMAQDFGEELQLCTDEERWAKETTYAVKREGRKTAIRVFKTIEEATELAEKEKGYVETRQGEYTRCAENFCGVAKWCAQYQGELNVTP
jgi:RecB family exonuclease